MDASGIDVAQENVRPAEGAMEIHRSKLVLGGAAIVLAAGYLGFTGARRGWVYYVDVDTFLAEHAGHAGQRARIHGSVEPDEVMIDRMGLNARFVLVGTTGRLDVAYSGAIPDMFEGGREVIVEGVLDQAGVFQADVLLTKCGSKYESSDAGHRQEPSP